VVLDQQQATITEERPARKNPMQDSEAKALLGQVEEVIIAKGKSSRRMKAKDTSVDDLKGPTGNIRAPLLRKGKLLLVGFHEGELNALLK
jgi:arsenate reductase-like glutaredoxin family protein